MKWLKYQHKFSSGRHAWEWKPIGDASKDVVEDVVRELASEYDHSDKYGGIDYEVLDVAPEWVIGRELRRAQSRADEACRTLSTWQAYVQDIATGGATFKCPQCDGAASPPKEGYYGAHSTVKPCPTCGREVIAATIAFWLMPSDKAAVKLLGSLVEQGARTLKLRHDARFRWPVKGKTEEDAFNRLVKLGLAGGSSYQNTHEIHATKSGEAEWLKHKEQQK